MHQKDPDIKHRGARQEVTLVTNGVKRVFSGKMFPGEFRVYQIFGDVSVRAEVEEAFQELAIKMGADRIVYKPRGA